MRADGKKVKNADAMYLVAAHFMAKRVDSMNMTTIDIPVEPMRQYLNKKRKEGKRYSHMTLFVTAFLHTLAQYPGLNRFVMNKRMYARNEIAIGMVVLKNGKMDQHGAMDKMFFKADNSLDEVDEIINSYVNKNRDEQDENATDKAVRVFLSIPGLVRIGVNFFRFIDRHNLMPKKFIDMSPFHATAVMTNLASIRTNEIYHHVYEFGTTSMSFALGNMREVPVRKKGEIEFVRCIPVGIVMDERIASGSYFALAFHKFQSLLQNPELLEEIPEVQEDVV